MHTELVVYVLAYVDDLMIIGTLRLFDKSYLNSRSTFSSRRLDI